MRRFDGKTVVVTGGSSGIGLATAKQFAAAGAHVIIVGRDPQSLAHSRDEIGGATVRIQADLNGMSGVAAAVQAIRAATTHVDILFANAGTSAVCAIEDTTEAVWDRIMNVNLKSVFFLIQALLPMMKKGSSIVMCASVSAVRVYPRGGIYCASKAALRSLTGSLASELAERGVRVNTLSPGSIATPMLGRTDGISAAMAEEFNQMQINAVPMKRQGLPEECASAVLFLASDEAAYVNGAEIVVDGGMIGPT